MEAGRNGRLFGQAFQDRNERGNLVQESVQISLRVSDGRGVGTKRLNGLDIERQFNG